MNTPQLETIDQVSDGWVKKYVLGYRMPDGTRHEYEVASRKSLTDYRKHLMDNAAGIAPAGADAVCIVARTPRDSVVMIREFRYPLNSWCIAFPAGLMDSGEGPIECAKRELEEETGYAVMPGSPVRQLDQAGYSSTGMTDETVQIIYVEAERAAEAHTEENELIETFELPIADIGTFLQRNTLPIGTRAQLVLEGLRKHGW